MLPVRCPAKINTRLRVVGRRPDGFHDLDLDFVGLALSDTLELERADTLELVLDGAASDLPVEDNLVLRAARRLRAAVGEARMPGARMRLTKRIPVAAGLGGGSSDAAGALLGLDRLWSLGLAGEVLAGIALGIGSDVPYFLEGGRRAGHGRGEILSRLPDGPEQPVLLVVSSQGLSTGMVFEEFARQAHPPASSVVLTSRKTGISFPNGTSDCGQGAPANDLLPAAVVLAPRLGELLQLARDVVPEGRVGLTGSGPTIFVLLEAGADSAEVKDRLAPVLPEGVALLATRTMAFAEHEGTRFSRLAG